MSPSTREKIRSDLFITDKESEVSIEQKMFCAAILSAGISTYDIERVLREYIRIKGEVYAMP